MKTFLGYFLQYIFKSKTRQKLLFLVMFGLFISSFSLMVLQGIMGGLQNGLVERSQKALGVGYYSFTSDEQELAQDFSNTLKKEKLRFYPMLDIEMLIQHDTRVAPVTLRGYDTLHAPPFIDSKDTKNIVLGADLATKIGAYYQSSVHLITPQFSDSLMGDVPRSSTELVSDFYSSELIEIDSVNAWVRLSFVQNLIRKRMINRIHFFHKDDFERAQSIPSIREVKTPFTWEEQNQSLVWALNLETSVMIFLFASMSFLVAINITSGFMIFFSKIKKDLLSFWILGQSMKKINHLTRFFSVSLSFIVTLLGALCGVATLLILDKTGINFMPEFFVERKIPVHMSYMQFVVSFGVPYLIALVFTKLSFRNFENNEQSFISAIRSVGN